jgi:hypothetical protein
MKWTAVCCFNHTSLNTVYFDVYCKHGKVLINKNSDLPEDGCSIIGVFGNRMEGVTHCMTRLDAAAKRT